MWHPQPCQISQAQSLCVSGVTNGKQGVWSTSHGFRGHRVCVGSGMHDMLRSSLEIIHTIACPYIDRSGGKPVSEDTNRVAFQSSLSILNATAHGNGSYTLSSVLSLLHKFSSILSLHSSETPREFCFARSLVALHRRLPLTVIRFHVCMACPLNWRRSIITGKQLFFLGLLQPPYPNLEYS